MNLGPHTHKKHIFQPSLLVDVLFLYCKRVNMSKSSCFENHEEATKLDLINVTNKHHNNKL